MIETKIIKDSIAPSGIRLTTFVLTFPRFILPEFNTHRMFSRNASSSRAIPVHKMLEAVKNNPVIPLTFTKNQKGMQAFEMIADQESAKNAWLAGRDSAVATVNELLNLGVHKQHANRPLEPYSWTSVVCTATEYANFFALRNHPMAQPEIAELAKQMWEAYKTNQPRAVQEYEPHLPFVSDKELDDAKKSGDCIDQILNCFKKSVARCARVSYLNHEGKQPTWEEDLGLFNRLVGSAPIHASPTEHQAWALSTKERSGNFIGWKQYRKSLQGENVEIYNGPEEE